MDPDLDAERLTYERRMGLALCELIEHLPVDALPQAGRASPVITVDLNFDALVSGVDAATLSTGGAMSASQPAGWRATPDCCPWCSEATL